MLRLIASGILLLPAALVMIATAPVVALLSLPAAFLLTYRKKDSEKANNKTGQQQYRRAIITGGSSGIGLAVAQECVQKGFDQVVILARNKDKLKAAQTSLQELASSSSSNNNKNTVILALSVDVSDLQKLQEAAKQIFVAEKDPEEEESPSLTYLYCIAGVATPYRFTDLTEEIILHNTKTNQLGSMYTVRAMLPHMKAGTIVLCSSMAGQIGVYGLGAYAPSKFALVGLAQVLHMELCHTPIHVCCAYPLDTDTPGYQTENLTKPPETHLISETVGLAQPGDVARKMVHDAMLSNPPFSIYFNFDAFMLSNLTAGMGPCSTTFDLVAQIAGMGIFRVVSLFYLNWFWDMLRDYAAKRNQQQPNAAAVVGEKTKGYGSTHANEEKTEKME